MNKGGRHHYLHNSSAAHLLRRLIHLSGLLVLWFYYQCADQLAQFLKIPLPYLIYFCLLFIIILEILRLAQGWIIFGQRYYEKKNISAFAWSAIGMALVLLFAPEKEFAIPIISAYALGDPVLGELRRTKLPNIVIIMTGILFISGIWWLSSLWFGTPGWLALIMGFITVAAEWPCIPWIDDNALIQIIPLIVITILK